MSETTPEPTVTEVDAPPTTGYALYDKSELRYLEGVFTSAKAARDAHKGNLREGHDYEARKV